MTGEGPDMTEHLDDKKTVFGDNTIMGLEKRLEKAELQVKYYQGQIEIITERHRAAFEYMNGLYSKVLAKNKKLKRTIQVKEMVIKEHEHWRCR